MITDRERMQLSLNKILAKFPRPGGLKGTFFDAGLNEVRTTILNLPDEDINELGKEFRLIWSVDPSRKA